MSFKSVLHNTVNDVGLDKLREGDGEGQTQIGTVVILRFGGTSMFSAVVRKTGVVSGLLVDVNIINISSRCIRDN